MQTIGEEYTDILPYQAKRRALPSKAVGSDLSYIILMAASDLDHPFTPSSLHPDLAVRCR